MRCKGSNYFLTYNISCNYFAPKMVRNGLKINILSTFGIKKVAFNRGKRPFCYSISSNTSLPKPHSGQA